MEDEKSESGRGPSAAADCSPAVPTLALFLFLQKSLGLTAPKAGPLPRRTRHANEQQTNQWGKKTFQLNDPLQLYSADL